MSRTRIRPALKMALALRACTRRTGGRCRRGLSGARRRPRSDLSAAGHHVRLPTLPAHPPNRTRRCASPRRSVVNWGGTPLPASQGPLPPILAGRPLPHALRSGTSPPAGVRRSYSHRRSRFCAARTVSTPARRAVALRPGALCRPAGPGLCVVRCLALAATSARRSRFRGLDPTSTGISRRGGLAAFGCSAVCIAVLNFACWALITPSFQAPDEVDHFAYTQSLVERAAAVARPLSPLRTLVDAEDLALKT